MRISEIETKPQKTGPGYYELFRNGKPNDMHDNAKFFDSYDEAVDWYKKYRIDYAIKNSGAKPEEFAVVRDSNTWEYFNTLPSPAKEKNNRLIDPKYFANALKFWTDYYGDSRRGAVEIYDYSNEVDAIIQQGGVLYRIVFLQKFEDLNRTDLGSHWTVDRDVIDDYIEGVEGRTHSEGKDVYVLLTAETPPNNIDNLSVDVRGNPEEKEVNIINPRACKFTAKILGTDKVIPLN